jgi:hypothetical protein
MKTVTVQADIPPSRELRVVLPDDVPTGPRQVLIVLEGLDEAEPVAAPIHLLSELLSSGFAGSWADRDDIGDSVEFARELRERAWRRTGDHEGETR